MTKVAAPRRQGLRGHPLAEVVLSYSDDRGRTLHVVPISPLDDQVRNWLPNLERSVGYNQVADIGLIYTSGPPGKGCDDMMSNEVYWIDTT